MVRVPLLAGFIGLVVVLQTAPLYIGLVLGAVLIVYGAVQGRSGAALGAAAEAYAIGYGMTGFLQGGLRSFAPAAEEMMIVLSRLSLAGYLIPLLAIALWLPARTHYFRIGSFRNDICTPFIWRGIRDPIWRFLLIGTMVIGACCLFLADFGGPQVLQLVQYGLLFAVINSVLEEVLWRGLILPRMVDYAGEAAGLLATSAAFGLYHYSLGFPWIVCFCFGLGGIFMGGVTIRSKGLAPAIVLHVVMNIAFVLNGLIFP
ncbi:lysostaphin resistance A-like protein [Paenibacillus chartarius]|uniref:Lysostaphin resistance A-like protein n=1 Tax=Paenibacillus chartarius TaxID=747481 RepID=A0ABV6DSI8_9BACL